MRALIQRAYPASVEVNKEIIGHIENGILIFLGVEQADGKEQAEKLWKKISKLRLFEDENGKTNLSLADIGGEVLIVSQFTLYANCKKGNRPSFTRAARPDQARELYEYFINLAKTDCEHVETGEFGACMEVKFTNHGPFTLWLDTDEL